MRDPCQGEQPRPKRVVLQEASSAAPIEVEPVPAQATSYTCWIMTAGAWPIRRLKDEF
jgi:hypothetical protein